MIEQNEAEFLVTEKIRELSNNFNVELSLLKEETITFEYGWMFFYQSKKFADTGDYNFMIGGNAPIIVDKHDSSIHITGTSENEDYYIDEYVKKRK